MPHANLRVRRILIGLSAAVALVGAATSPAVALAEDGEKDAPPGLVSYEGPMPEGISMTLPAEYRSDSELPPATSDGLWALQVSGKGDAANTFEWLPDSGVLRIYSAEGEEYWAPVLAEYLPKQDVELREATHSKSDIDQAIESILGADGQLDESTRIAYALPANDGSEITLGIDAASGVGNAEALLAQRRTSSSIPVKLEEAPEVIAADRNVSASSASWLAGAIMSRPAATPGYIDICSTGWRIGKLSDGTRGMLSAHHCGDAKTGTAWHYSKTNSPPATHLGDYQGSLASGSVFSDTGLWTGGNLSKFIPAVYTGDFNDASTGAWVRGGSYPVIGTQVCYSGARSGNVCNNNVTVTGATFCYAGHPCYAGLTVTQQASFIESAGQGDSGGPVYQSVAGGVHAAGVISGIIGGSTTCTGEAGGRLCSPTAIFAPVVAAIGSGGSWGLSYIP